MPRAFEIWYLKSMCIFQNELKLQPKIPQISRKCLEANFRCRFCQVQQVNVKDKNYGQFPGVFIKLYKKFWAISTIKWLRKKIRHKTKRFQVDRDSVNTLPSMQKSFFLNGTFSGYSFLNPSFRDCFGKTMPRAFGIRYLKSLCIFSNELKLQPKIPQISRKCLEAKFRGRFRQVQQVNFKEKNYGQFPQVLIKLYKKFWAISTKNDGGKKSAVKRKNFNLIGSFSALGEISHMVTFF